MDMERPESSPCDGQKITSPATQLIKSVSHPFSLWSAELKKTGLAFDESDAVAFWNVLSAIYALTEEEHVKLRATDAYAFAGGSATTGKRKLAALIQAKLVLTTRNTAKRNEKFGLCFGRGETRSFADPRPIERLLRGGILRLSQIQIVRRRPTAWRVVDFLVLTSRRPWFLPFRP